MQCQPCARNNSLHKMPVVYPLRNTERQDEWKSLMQHSGATEGFWAFVRRRFTRFRVMSKYKMTIDCLTPTPGQHAAWHPTCMLLSDQAPTVSLTLLLQRDARSCWSSRAI